ncbi:MAG: hypothetical protein CSA65_02050 [Proteobacteria bacterium]|nr:MAG: hypothetical protein CSA65_02050 [Pseudomonadota bacterium]
MYDTRRDDRPFDESKATLLLHFQDDADDDPHEEREVWIWRTADGSYYWKHSYTHVIDGQPGHSIGWISEVKVHYELMMLGAGEVFVEHFPESWQARCQRRHGSISLENLGLHPQPLYEGATKVMDLPARPYEGERALYLTDVGLFITVPVNTPPPEDGGAKSLEDEYEVRLYEDGYALEEATRAGASRDVLARFWPDELEAPLLDLLGLDSWAALEQEQGVKALLERCELCHSYASETSEREGSIAEEALYRLIVKVAGFDQMFVIVRRRRDRDGREVEIVRPIDALIEAKGMKGFEEARLREVFDEAIWRGAAEQLGRPLS